MGMKIWPQSFTVLGNLPAYAAALAAHFKKVARADTEVVLHGMHDETYKTNYPGNDIRYAYMQYLHGQQFVLGSIQAEEQGFDAYSIMSIPEPALRVARSIVDIPVVGYGESSFLTASMLGERVGVLLFITEMAPLIQENAERVIPAHRFAGVRPVGFTFNDVLQAFDKSEPLLEKLRESARALINDGADVIIPGEAPLCVLLARNGLNRVDDVPIMDAIGATIKMAESMVDLKRSSGMTPARRGYYMDKPPRERVKELLDLYGITRLAQTPHKPKR
jgi:Asp/Glu/hydantoin racemase